MHVEQFFLDGLGHQSYLVADSASGVAAVVDPRRDVDVYLDAASHASVRITHILETHIHNDYVTGARELAARTDATIVASAAATLAYPNQPVRGGDRVAMGDLSFRVLETPGHTPEHVSYVLYEGGREAPEAVFSGGSMLVGGSGRTDLLGEAATLSLTHQQYHSLLRLLDELPDHVLVYPTHGAGSFCVATPGNSAHASTIGQERMANPAVHARDAEDFVLRQLASYGEYPAYYRFMRAVNQQGPRVLGALPQPGGLAPVEVRDRMDAGVPLVDGRHRAAFAREHIPGALHIELGSSFSTYVGWLLPFNVPLVLLVEDEAGRAEAIVQLVRIGYEQVQGFLEGGMGAWKATGLPVHSFPRIDVTALHERWAGGEPLTIVDVRRDDEWREGHIPGARHIYVADLPRRLDEIPSDHPVAMICASGFRASTAAGILATAGRQVIAVGGGMPDWIRRGYPATMEERATRVAVDPASHAHP